MRANQVNIFIDSLASSGMWNEPSPSQLEKIPALYTNEETPTRDILIHMHFFLGGCDWYAAEYDAHERVFFGYAILNNDSVNAEWGYTSLDELREVRTRQGHEVDRDLHWSTRKAMEIEKIAESYRHKGLSDEE